MSAGILPGAGRDLAARGTPSTSWLQKFNFYGFYGQPLPSEPLHFPKSSGPYPMAVKILKLLCSACSTRDTCRLSVTCPTPLKKLQPYPQHPWHLERPARSGLGERSCQHGCKHG